MMGNFTLGANTPSWMANAVAGQPKATRESADFPTVSWCLFLIPVYGDKAGGPTSFSG